MTSSRVREDERVQQIEVDAMLKVVSEKCPDEANKNHERCTERIVLSAHEQLRMNKRLR
jgi:adenylosuccinate lyase